jgi:hypothetical protein
MSEAGKSLINPIGCQAKNVEREPHLWEFRTVLVLAQGERLGSRPTLTVDPGRMGASSLRPVLTPFIIDKPPTAQPDFNRPAPSEACDPRRHRRRNHGTAFSSRSNSGFEIPIARRQQEERWWIGGLVIAVVAVFARLVTTTSSPLRPPAPR